MNATIAARLTDSSHLRLAARALTLRVVAGAILLVVSANAAFATGGDDCASAVFITALPFSDTGDTSAYVDDYDAAGRSATGAGAPDVVYSILPLADVTVDISVRSAGGPEMGLALYEGDCAPNFAKAHSDPRSTANTGGGGGALVRELRGITLSALTPYFIVVEGFEGGAGLYTIEVGEASGCALTCPGGAIAEGEACGSDTNGGCNSGPPVFTSISDGDQICGEAWAESSVRDTDWYEVVLTQPSRLTWSVEAEFSVAMGLVDSNNPGSGNCADITGFLSPFGTAGPCEPVEITTDVLPVGTHWVFVATNGFDGVPCGTNNDYIATLVVDPVVVGAPVIECPDPLTIPAGPDCTAPLPDLTDDVVVIEPSGDTVSVALTKEAQGAGNKGLSFRPVDSNNQPQAIVLTARTSVDSGAPLDPNASGDPGTVFIDSDGTGVKTDSDGGSKGISGGGGDQDEEIIFTPDSPAAADSVRIGINKIDFGDGFGDKDDPVIYAWVEGGGILVFDETQIEPAFTFTGSESGFVDFAVLIGAGPRLTKWALREVKDHTFVTSVDFTEDPNVLITQDPVAGTVVGLGLTVVTITVTDLDTGQSTDCTVDVTVEGPCGGDTDGDGVPDDQDDDPDDPNVCRDLDADGCDDCSVTGADGSGGDTNNDGTDTDGDGICDLGDPDDDNDGCLDGDDDFPLIFSPDTDSDGLANDCDPDDDNDGIIDGLDVDPLDPFRCQDADADSCDDCSVGVDGLGPLADNDPSNDGTDTDGDGQCDAGDPDDDNDGVPDVDDPDDSDPDVCGDSDGDTCDDCAVGTDGFGPLPDNDPSNDGPDTDSDGLCDAGDPDDDNDGVPDVDDPDDSDPDVCGDSDGDTCDDCSVGTDDFGPLSDSDPANDGPDLDEDGFCDAGDCDADDDGYLATGACGGADCNDLDDTVNPDAEEVCGDGIDNDCDGFIDNGSRWYRDGDGDTWGQEFDFQDACVQPSGFVSRFGDCDDSDSLINPDADEVCDGVDNDCDGFIDDDDDDTIGQTAYYVDDDGDSWGTGAPLFFCIQPPDTVDRPGDCDDTDPLINPDADEVCDGGIDNDCDGFADDDDNDTIGQTTFYLDNDGDGYGQTNNTLDACVQPQGYAPLPDDCDDTNNAVNPGADEVCDGIDNDCDTLVDDADPDVIDNTPPTITDPPDLNVNSDAGVCTATIVIPDPAVSDTCTAEQDLVITSERSDGKPTLAEPFDANTAVTITWTVTDLAGLTATTEQVVTVSDQNEFYGTMSYPGNTSHFEPASRCMEFQFFPAGPTILLQVEFSGGIGNTGTIDSALPALVDCGDYDCVLVDDPYHSLRRVASIVKTLGTGPTGRDQYQITAVDLIPSDLNNDGTVGFSDFSILSGLQGMGNGDPSVVCGPFPPTVLSADLDQSGLVDFAGDFGLFQFGFLNDTGDDSCIPGPMSAVNDREPISVEELWRQGLGQFTVADVTGDGWIDYDDIVAVANGARPRVLSVFMGEGGSWFKESNWSRGGRPDADTDVAFDTHVVIDRPGALAGNLEIRGGGRLSLINGALKANRLTVRDGATLSLVGASSTLSVEALVLEDGATLVWNGGTIEIAGGAFAQADLDLIVGDSAVISSLRLVDGASAKITRDTFLGYDEGDVGVLQIEGSTFTTGSTLFVGFDGVGHLHVASGGVVSAGDLVVVSGFGQVTGDGTLESTVRNLGVLAPHGALTVVGDYHQVFVTRADNQLAPVVFAGELEIKLGRDGYDQLVVDGDAYLGGTLRLMLEQGYEPEVGEFFEIVLGERIVDIFEQVQIPQIPGLTFKIISEGGRVAVMVEAGQ